MGAMARMPKLASRPSLAKPVSTRISLQSISKRYGRGTNQVEALKDVSLSLGTGEFLAIRGPSGSGKSSLLNILGLIDSPNSGRYQFNNQAIEQLNQQQRCDYRRQHIGFIFQHHQLIPAMTVAENIAYPLLLNKINRKTIKQEVSCFLDKIGLSQRAKHLPKQLSGGERQRVGIARALIKKPQLIIADEPSASLDHKQAQTCLQLMRELNQQYGASFVIASHDNFVIEYCDREIKLLDGRMGTAS